MIVDTPAISHGSTPSVIPNNPHVDTAPDIPTANAALTLRRVSQSPKTAIPSKRSYPFIGDEPRKKKRTEIYINVRIYAKKNDVEHTHEIQCALTPDGGLDLVGLSQKFNLATYQVSRFISFRFLAVAVLIMLIIS